MDVMEWPWFRTECPQGVKASCAWRDLKFMMFGCFWFSRSTGIWVDFFNVHVSVETSISYLTWLTSPCRNLFEYKNCVYANRKSFDVLFIYLFIHLSITYLIPWLDMSFKFRNVVTVWGIPVTKAPSTTVLFNFNWFGVIGYYLVFNI